MNTTIERNMYNYYQSNKDVPLELLKLVKVYRYRTTGKGELKQFLDYIESADIITGADYKRETGLFFDIFTSEVTSQTPYDGDKIVVTKYKNLNL